MTIENLGWLLTALSLVGVWLNIKKDVRCFYLWTFTNGSWAAVDWYAGLYAQSALFSIYFVLAIWGIYAWKTNRKENKQWK